MVRQVLNINKCKIAFYGRDVNYEYKYYLSSTALESVDVIKDWMRASKLVLTVRH